MGSVTDLTMASMWKRSATVYARRTAVTDGSVGLSYAELDARTARLAAGLQSLGIDRGDRISVLSETRFEYVETYLAAAKLGVAVAGLNTRLHPQELAQCVDRARPRVLLVSAQYAELFSAFCATSSHRPTVVGLDGGADAWLNFDDLMSDPAGPVPDVDGEDIHAIVFTSGTTGAPKGAMISQRAAVTRAMQIVYGHGFTNLDVFGAWLPLFHTGGKEYLDATLMAGGTYAINRSADPTSLARLVEEQRITVIPLVPGMFEGLVAEFGKRGVTTTSIRMGVGYGNLLPQDMLSEFMSRYNVAYVDMYGSTETGIMVAYCVAMPGDQNLGKWAKAPGVLVDSRLVDFDDVDVMPGQSGECLVRGPSVMSGYLDEDGDAETFRDNWLRTGDILTLGDDGTATFADRKKYLIKSGGENVYPAEVEQAILSHPDVADVVVVRTTDATWGEAVRAFVVRRPGRDVAGSTLVDWCRASIAGYKRPRYVRFIDQAEIPRNFAGKVVRQIMEEIPISFDELIS